VNLYKLRYFFDRKIWRFHVLSVYLHRNLFTKFKANHYGNKWNPSTSGIAFSVCGVRSAHRGDDAQRNGLYHHSEALHGMEEMGDALRDSPWDALPCSQLPTRGLSRTLAQQP
jgi:hypothetical protein